jgi:hypothetical protein
VGFLPRWIIMVAAGEALGFLIPASMGAWLGLTGAPDTVVYPAMIAAGACEGALLGYGQWLGFGRGVVSRVPWIVATSAGAAVAWSLGMLPGIQGGLDISSPPTLALVTGGAMLLLVTIPSLQWLVLRRGGSQTLRWIPVNAGAWAAGLLWTVAPSPIVDERTQWPGSSWRSPSQHSPDQRHDESRQAWRGRDVPPVEGNGHARGADLA